MSVGEASQYAVQLNRYLLRLIGVWPLDTNAHILSRLVQKLSILTSYFLTNFLLIPCTLHAFLEETDPELKLKQVGPITFHAAAVAKYYFLVSGIEEIGLCFRHVEDDWKFYKDADAKSELSIMQRKAKLGRFLMLLCASFMYGGSLFYHGFMPISASRMATSATFERLAELRLTRNLTDLVVRAEIPRILAYPVYERLMNIEKSPWYEIVFFVQFIAAQVSCTITVAVCSLAASYVVHVCGQLEIVMSLLDDFVRGKDAGSADKMREIVDKHIRALRFAMRVEKYLSPLCFVEFVNCTLQICLVGYHFIMEWENRNTVSSMTYCSLFISFSFNIFIFCYIGEILTEQCKKVGEITYKIDWYELPNKKAADIIMIMIISSCYPARISAGKMVYLSMASFSNVMKTAATYLNMLRTLML